jgi:hypothetical protein
MTTAPNIPEGYRLDAHQRLVPLAHIEPSDLLRDQLVTKLVERAKPIKETLAVFREQAFADIDANTRGYIRIYERVGTTDRYEPINLDLSKA